MAIWAPICPAPTTRIRFTSSAVMVSPRSSSDVSVEGRRELSPGLGALEGVGGPQHRHVVEAAAHDLEAHGKLVRGEAGGHRAGGLARHVERIREGDTLVRLRGAGRP